MKNVLLLFAISLISFQGFTNTKCPVFIEGIIKIVNENNQTVQTAEIWGYNSLNDSFKISKGLKKYEEKDKIDTNRFYIWSYHFGSWGYSYFNDNYKPADKLFRIRAEGFTDIIIKSIDFREKNYWDTINPTLIITLYSKKYIQSNNALTLLDYVTINKTIRVTDSASTLLKDYIRRDPTSRPFEDNFATKITTYPNPVTTELKIQVNYNITEPVQATLSDAQGRKVDEILVEGTMTNVNLDGYKPGHYYLTIVNAKGEFMHRQLIIKE